MYFLLCFIVLYYFCESFVDLEAILICKIRFGKTSAISAFRIKFLISEPSVIRFQDGLSDRNN